MRSIYMRAVRFAEGKVQVQDTPSPSGDGVRVQVRSIGICGSEVHMLEKGFPISGVPGHEFAGELDDGTPVGVEPLAPCGVCEQCSTGDYNMCTIGPSMVLGVGIDGGMAEEALVPERSLVYLPGNVDVKDACLIEPLAVALHGLRKAGLDGRMRVAVVGGGAVGLCAVAGAVDACAEVGLLARYPHQVDAGKRLGAKGVNGTYDLVVECAGSESAVHEAVQLCRPNGRLLLLGTFWDGLNLPHYAVAQKGLTLFVALTYAISGVGRDCDLAAALLAGNPEIARSLITHRFPLEEAPKAFEIARDRKAGAIKVVLEP
jgi:threonine dehydrogenase-like Zn-dependent dehydrogenase